MNFADKKIDTIIVLGTFLSRESETNIKQLEEWLQKGVKLIYLFSMEDPIYSPKSHFFSRYEVGSEEGVLALLAKALLAKKTLPRTLQHYFDDLDEGYLSAESNVGEEEIEEIQALCSDNSTCLLWLGSDITKHPYAQNCMRLADVIASYGNGSVYGMDLQEKNDKKDIEEVAPLKSYDGTVVYACSQIKSDESGLLIGSAQFALAAKIRHQDKVKVAIKQEVYSCTFVQDNSLKGTIALMPVQDNGQKYPYSVAKIAKAEAS